MTEVDCWKHRLSWFFRSNPRLIIRLSMLLLLIAGLALRLYGLNWDQGYGVHPDERYISWIASSVRLPNRLSDLFRPALTGLNPYMWPPDGAGSLQEQLDRDSSEDRSRPFSYGHLPLYLLVLTGGGDTQEARLALVGRVLSALFDTVTILLTFALGRMLYNATVGLVAAAFVTLTVMHIQLAHFATFDTILTCFAIATLLSATRFAQAGRRRDAIAAGLFWGLAFGTKFSAILLLAPLTMAYAMCRDHRPLESTERERWPPRGLPLVGARCRGAGLFSLSLLVAIVVFGLTNPFSLIQPSEFIENLGNQGAMLRGDDDFPFTRQYHGTWPYVYPIEQQLRWGMGLPLGLMVFSGLVYALIRGWCSRVPAEMLIPWTWVVFYFGLVGSLYVKFMRYMLPVLPVLAIYGAGMMEEIRSRANRCRVWVRGLGLAFVSFVFLITIVYDLAFLNVYRGDHPWLRLSRWIYAHVPAGATISHERWDHHLPLTIEQGEEVRWPGEYRQQVLDPFAPDTPAKLRTMLRQLAVSDYLIVASTRLYASTARWPARYPMMHRYYTRLFDGKLGYQLVALPDVERYPQMGPLALVSDPFGSIDLPSPLPRDQERPAPLTLNLGRADESFIVYDHPRPLLFRNVARLSPMEMERLFADLMGDGDQ